MCMLNIFPSFLLNLMFIVLFLEFSVIKLYCWQFCNSYFSHVNFNIICCVQSSPMKNNKTSQKCKVKFIPKVTLDLTASQWTTVYVDGSVIWNWCNVFSISIEANTPYLGERENNFFFVFKFFIYFFAYKYLICMICKCVKALLRLHIPYFDCSIRTSRYEAWVVRWNWNTEHPRTVTGNRSR